MRQIILDTETTGLDPSLGHRIIEVAGVELVDRRLTGRHFHRYVNPGRDSDPGALQVHGLTSEFLADKPKFGEIAAELLEYIEGAELIIHNAPFDIGFLDQELARLDLKPVRECCGGVLDTLRLAREMYPGKRNGLDSLCARLGVDNSARTLHGALLDAQLLAEVYITMTRGQERLVMDVEAPVVAVQVEVVSREGLELRVIPASADELAEHELLLAEVREASGKSLWG